MHILYFVHFHKKRGLIRGVKLKIRSNL
jgi:hypothetical protein